MSDTTNSPANQSKIDPLLRQCHDFWFGLFQKAMDKRPFDTLCTLLRPGGAHSAGWDVLDEAETTFQDFNWMLDVAQKTKGKATARRFALYYYYYYCFLVEMTAIHEMMINLLRCVTDQHYLPFPFQPLYRRKKKNDPWNVVPPSMARKIKEIVELATKAGEINLVSKLNYVFDDNLRNALVHSDYVLTADQLRRESGPAMAIPLTEVDQKVNYTFSFLSGLLKAASNMKYALRRAKKYHKWENYEVLELLADENGVYGFNVHFSNGNKSTFSRTKDGATQVNMRTSKVVGFMVGMIDHLEPVWKVDGIPVTDWEELSKRRASEPP
jgi:hypothetical protein